MIPNVSPPDPFHNRLRVEVSSAAFPLFERNLNTRGSNETETHFASAEQTIYHDARHPSHILLPMIPDK
jgi:predicted acyl esterase